MDTFTERALLQEAPPVKRNVPRPSIPRYGPPSLNGSNSSMSFGSTAGKGALPQLSSGSISGANLYIPPYAPQAARVPSPASQPGQSTSFADLGLPSGHRKSSPLPVRLLQTGVETWSDGTLSPFNRRNMAISHRFLHHCPSTVGPLLTYSPGRCRRCL